MNENKNVAANKQSTPKGTFHGVEKVGTIWAFNPLRQVGTIIDSNNTRYFFNKANIIAGPPEVKLMDQVRFFVDSTRPVTAGRMPIAFGITILAYQAGENALAEKVEPEVK